MKKWCTAFFMAWGMFWIVPCPYKKWDGALFPRMLLCLPLIGLLMGGAWAGAAWLLVALSAPAAVSAAVLAALPCILTGFIHMDGYMDCADAILSRRDLPERRRILKDSHVGAFAVIALALWLLLAFSLLLGADLSGKRWGLALIPAAVRCCAAAAVLTLPAMDTSGYAGLRPEKGLRAAVFLLLAALVLLPPVLLGPWGLCTAAAALGAFFTVWRAFRSLEGMNGDISGAAVTVGELCGLAALCLI